jgi:hypothetical protein
MAAPIVSTLYAAPTRNECRLRRRAAPLVKVAGHPRPFGRESAWSTQREFAWLMVFVKHSAGVRVVDLMMLADPILFRTIEKNIVFVNRTIFDRARNIRRRSGINSRPAMRGDKNGRCRRISVTGT